MNVTGQLHDLGQSLWLDNITRALLSDGSLSRYIREYSIPGLTSNPTIFEQAIGGSSLYDEGIRRKAAEGKSGEDLLFELGKALARRTAAEIVATSEPPLTHDSSTNALIRRYRRLRGRLREPRT